MKKVILETKKFGKNGLSQTVLLGNGEIEKRESHTALNVQCTLGGHKFIASKLTIESRFPIE